MAGGLTGKIIERLLRPITKVMPKLDGSLTKLVRYGYDIGEHGLFGTWLRKRARKLTKPLELLGSRNLKNEIRSNKLVWREFQKAHPTKFITKLMKFAVAGAIVWGGKKILTNSLGNLFGNNKVPDGTSTSDSGTGTTSNQADVKHAIDNGQANTNRDITQLSNKVSNNEAKMNLATKIAEAKSERDSLHQVAKQSKIPVQATPDKLTAIYSSKADPNDKLDAIIKLLNQQAEIQNDTRKSTLEQLKLNQAELLNKESKANQLYNSLLQLQQQNNSANADVARGIKSTMEANNRLIEQSLKTPKKLEVKELKGLSKLAGLGILGLGIFDLLKNNGEGTMRLLSYISEGVSKLGDISHSILGVVHNGFSGLAGLLGIEGSTTGQSERERNHEYGGSGEYTEGELDQETAKELLGKNINEITQVEHKDFEDVVKDQYDIGTEAIVATVNGLITKKQLSKSAEKGVQTLLDDYNAAKYGLEKARESGDTKLIQRMEKRVTEASNNLSKVYENYIKSESRNISDRMLHGLKSAGWEDNVETLFKNLSPEESDRLFSKIGEFDNVGKAVNKTASEVMTDVVTTAAKTGERKFTNKSAVKVLLKKGVTFDNVTEDAFLKEVLKRTLKELEENAAKKGRKFTQSQLARRVLITNLRNQIARKILPKAIPVAGGLISLVAIPDAIKRFKRGQIVQGFLELSFAATGVGSAILDFFSAGTASAVFMGVDVGSLIALVIKDYYDQQKYIQSKNVKGLVESFGLGYSVVAQMAYMPDQDGNIPDKTDEIRKFSDKINTFSKAFRLGGETRFDLLMLLINCDDECPVKKDIINKYSSLSSMRNKKWTLFECCLVGIIANNPSIVKSIIEDKSLNDQLVDQLIQLSMTTAGMMTIYHNLVYFANGNVDKVKEDLSNKLDPLFGSIAYMPLTQQVLGMKIPTAFGTQMANELFATGDGTKLENMFKKIGNASKVNSCGYGNAIASTPWRKYRVGNFTNNKNLTSILTSDYKYDPDMNDDWLFTSKKTKAIHYLATEDGIALGEDSKAGEMTEDQYYQLNKDRVDAKIKEIKDDSEKALAKYAFGTKSHPGGKAIVGDGGKREVIITPDNKAYLTDDKPQLVDLPKGTKVIPSIDDASKLEVGSIDEQLNDEIELRDDSEIIGDCDINDSLKDEGLIPLYAEGTDKPQFSGMNLIGDLSTAPQDVREQYISDLRSQSEIAKKNNSGKGFDILAAVTKLNDSAHSKSTGYCARYVANALEAGGVKFKRQRSAHDYHAKDVLSKAGWHEVPMYNGEFLVNGGTPNIGDIVIEEATKNHKYGHIQMWNGHNWVSDFYQRGLHVHRDGTGPLHYYTPSYVKTQSDNLVAQGYVAPVKPTDNSPINEFVDPADNKRPSSIFDFNNFENFEKLLAGGKFSDDDVRSMVSSVAGFGDGKEYVGSSTESKTTKPTTPVKLINNSPVNNEGDVITYNNITHNYFTADASKQAELN